MLVLKNDANGNGNGNGLSGTGPSRWAGVHRPFTAADVVRLRNSFEIRYSIAERAPRSSGTC
jgi:hypothetical protein